MPRPDPQKVKGALQQLSEYLDTLGTNDAATREAIARFSTRIDSERWTNALRDELNHFKDPLFLATREKIWAGAHMPGRNAAQTEEEFYYSPFKDLNDAMYPSDLPPEMDISDVPGTKDFHSKKIRYIGDPAGVRSVMKKTIPFIEKFCEAVGKGEFETAYAMISPRVREWMTLNRFIADHRTAEKRYKGKALNFSIDAFTLVLADDAAGKKSSAEWGWPKGPDKSTRRAILNGFWIRNASNQTGCWGAYWVTEEDGEYRVAKFSFYDQ